MGIQRLGKLINDKSMRINEVSLRRNINDKSMRINDGAKRAKAGYTECIADRLVNIYNAPASRNFFLKCAWHLSEDEIWSAVESSRRKTIKSPIKYFVAICNKALRERCIGQ